MPQCIPQLRDDHHIATRRAKSGLLCVRLRLTPVDTVTGRPTILTNKGAELRTYSDFFYRDKDTGKWKRR